MNKKKLIKYLKNFEFTYDIDTDYRNIYNACTEYMNNTNDYNIEYCFDNIITYEEAEERAKYELNNNGLVRLYYFLGDANCNYDLFRTDGYGNLTNCYTDDLKDLVDEIIANLE